MSARRGQSPGAQASRHPFPSPPDDRAVPLSSRVRLDPRVRRWADGSVLIGGAPWRLSRLAGRTRELVGRLAAAGPAGVVVATEPEAQVARELLDRGFAHAIAVAAPSPSVVAVVPVLDRAASLDRLLTSLGGQPTMVVDDGSSDPAVIAATAERHGAALACHEVNRGPAAARNTGLRATTAELVAFIDSDCTAGPDWPTGLLFHFQDPAVAAVAPRVVPTAAKGGLIQRYEAGRSSLDMGRYPELVRPGARLGFVPSAALVVRRAALGDGGFDEDLRLGEDVDLVWRLVETGWHVRYDPSVQVEHETLTRWRSWVTRRFEYGTSAAALEDRHPGRLAPARVSAWNLACLGLLSANRVVASALVGVAATGMLRRRLQDLPRPSTLAARTVGQGLVADAVALGHLLRREWWPLGALALAAAPRVRAARWAAACMLGPIAWEWLVERPSIDPVRYALLRLVDDAAYGSGVIASSLKARSARPLMPLVSGPMLRRRAGAPGGEPGGSSQASGPGSSSP